MNTNDLVSDSEIEDEDEDFGIGIDSEKEREVRLTIDALLGEMTNATVVDGSVDVADVEDSFRDKEAKCEASI